MTNDEKERRSDGRAAVSGADSFTAAIQFPVVRVSVDELLEGHSTSKPPGLALISSPLSIVN